MFEDSLEKKKVSVVKYDWRKELCLEHKKKEINFFVDSGMGTRSELKELYDYDGMMYSQRECALCQWKIRTEKKELKAKVRAENFRNFYSASLFDAPVESLENEADDDKKGGDL